MVPNITEWYQNALNGSKLYPMVLIGTNWYQMVPIDAKWYQSVLNGTELGHMVLNVTNWFKDVGRWCQMVANGGKW